MGQRIAYGSMALLFLVSAFLVDIQVGRAASARDGALFELLARGSVIPLFFGLVLLRGAFEMIQMARTRGMAPHAGFTLLMTVLLFWSPWLSAGGCLGGGVSDREGLYWPLALVMFTVIGAGLITIVRRRVSGAIADVSATVMVVLYIGFLGSFALQIRGGLGSPGDQGAWLLLITLLVTKFSDIGAYFVGSAMGRHKLIPSVSPGKSIEGAIGGIAASAGLAALLANLSGMAKAWGSEPFQALATEATKVFALDLGGSTMSPTARALAFGAVISVVAQLGDLLESCFKRDAGLKDSGHLLPRFGGVMDIIDSPVLALPAAWFMFTRAWGVL